MSARPRIIVVGLGAMGSATVWALSSRNADIVGIDRFAPPHALGSTHGKTRIIREAYYEHPLYVPLVQRAYKLWSQLEQDAGARLFVETGGLMIGPPNGVLVEGTLRSVREHGLRHEVLDATALRKRFPDFHADEEMVAVVEPRAGLLLPERCVENFQNVARSRGARIRHDLLVRGWSAKSDGIVVDTDAGDERADYLVLAAGPWMPDLLGAGVAPLEIERQLFHWFAPKQGRQRLGPDRTPIALWEYAPDRLVATFPDLGDGMKVGVHHEGELTHPDRVRREVSSAEDGAVRGLLERFIPSAAGELVDSSVCVYTNTPDHDFVVDWHPRSDRVLILSPCSGHGFKFASAIGEIAADLTTRGSSDFDLSPFRLGRFDSQRPRT